MKQIWAVHHAEAQTDSSMQVAPQGGPHHAFLFMSDPQAGETTVMRLGDGMERVVQDHSCGCVFTAPTVAAANLLDHTRIIQACHSLQPDSFERAAVICSAAEAL